MHTLYNMTFAELHSKSAAELNEIQIEFSMDAIRRSLSGYDDMWEGDEQEKFMAHYREAIAKLFAEICDAEYYYTLRLVYDTEEKFNAMAKVMLKLTDLPNRMQKIVSDVTDSILGGA